MKKLRYGIIGTGNIGMTKHLPGYSQLKDTVEIAAACDINPDALKSAAEKYSIMSTYEDYNKLLERDDIDFVSVCLPNYLHHPVTVKALMSGKHVHCEKPMAMNPSEAHDMNTAKEKSGKKLMIGLNNRFTGESQFVKRYVSEGNLGDIYHVKCGWQRRACAGAYGWFTDKSQSGGGPLIDLGVHYIDLAMYFMGYPKVESVTARTYSKLVGSDKGYLFTHDNSRLTDGKKFDVEDLAVGFIGLENDATIDFEVSWASHIARERIYYSLYGTKGGISFVKEAGETSLRIHTIVNDTHADIVPSINRRLTEVNEFADFVSCINENREPTISVLSQNVDMIGLIDLIYRSAGEKRTISPSEVM